MIFCSPTLFSTRSLVKFNCLLKPHRLCIKSTLIGLTFDTPHLPQKKRAFVWHLVAFLTLVQTSFVDSGDYVAHIKFTVLLMPNGSDRVTSHTLQELQPTKTIDDPEIKAWLALATKSKKKGGGKKKKGKSERNHRIVTDKLFPEIKFSCISCTLQVRRVTKRKTQLSQWMQRQTVLDPKNETFIRFPHLHLHFPILVQC